MWHEARKQERKIRTLMVDYKRRADRRRVFYEKIKLDPAQFLRMYGRPVKIHLEASVALAAESPQSMMAWQGDPNVMIDRFDGRAHLDFIPERKTTEPELSSDEEEEERLCSYERYRILVQNECAAVSEDQCLRQIYIDEIYGSQDDKSREKEKEDEKKKGADKKAAIGFTYADSTPSTWQDEKQPAKGDDDDDEDEDDDSILSDEEIDLDAVFDIDKLTNEQTEALNLCSNQYGMLDTDFFDSLWKDKEAAEELKMAKIMEEEKAQFSGRKSRRERRAFKEKKLKEKYQNSPISYAARSSPTYATYKDHSSSRSRSPEIPERTLFITSFGGSDDEEGVIQGPMLPPHLQPTATSKNNKARLHASESPPNVRSHPNASSNISSCRKRRGNSASRSKSRSRSRGRRSRSRSRPRYRQSWRARPDRRSRSTSRPRRMSRRRSRSNSRFRSRSWSRRRSSRSRSRSRGRRRRSRSFARRRGRYRSKSSSRSRSYSRSRSRSSRSRTRRSSRSSSRSLSPAKPVVKRYRRPSLESSNGSNLESDTETHESSTNIKGSEKRDVLGKKDGASSKSALSAAEKLKKRMQAALNKHYKADKRKEMEKQVKQEEERMDREEELRNMAIALRRREREKRHRERDEIENLEWQQTQSSGRWHRSRRSRSKSSRSRSRSRRRRTRSPSKSDQSDFPDRHQKSSHKSPSKRTPQLVDY